MKLEVFPNSDVLAEKVADYILNLLEEKPNATLVLTSGSTPIKTYHILAQKAKKELFSKAFIIGLDEWVGIGPKSEGSCRYIVEQNLLIPLGVSEKQYTFFDSLTSNLDSECQRVDQIIFDRGGLDFILVGIGLNGHIGLNEPGSSFMSYCQVTLLEEITINTGQKYFNTQTPLTQGITVGLKHLTQSKSAMIIAGGESKAAIIKKTIDSPITENIPSTILKLHKNGMLWVDQEAASLI
jgi:galactosamine-6-phosphate isomerase